MAEGEFALIREYGEAGLIRPSKGWATFGDHDLYSLLVDAAVRGRDETALRQYIPLAEETASRYDHKLYQAVAHRARGVLHRLAGEYVEAETKLNQALEMFNDMDTRYQIGRTSFELGDLAVSQKEPATAREHLTRALNGFEGIGAAPDALRVRERLTAL
jgi:hypothetical protein